MASTAVLVPGEDIPSDLLPQPNKPNQSLTIGPGLRHIPPASVTATVAGAINVDSRKNALWVDIDHGRYTPSTGDLVIVTMHHSSTDINHCVITPHTPPATLPQLSFEGATKKTRPILAPGALIYARVSSASKHMEPELECVHPSSGKSEGLGPLKGGMVFDISLAFARRLIMGERGGVIVLEELGAKVRFEVAVGRNGRVWVDGGNVKTTIAVGKALQEADQKRLSVMEQKTMVEKTLRTL